MHQRAELYEAGDVESTRRLETGHYLPGTCDDTNYANYFAVQFAWGKKVMSFYRHPCDDFKCARGTKNIMGR